MKIESWITKVIDNLKFAPYWEALLSLWAIESIQDPVISWILLIIGAIEINNSFKTKKRVENILNKESNKKEIFFNKYKDRFCDRQATISAIKNKWTNDDLEKFYEILDENKKNSNDILLWHYIK